MNFDRPHCAGLRHRLLALLGLTSHLALCPALASASRMGHMDFASRRVAFRYPVHPPLFGAANCMNACNTRLLRVQQGR